MDDNVFKIAGKKITINDNSISIFISKTLPQTTILISNILSVEIQKPSLLQKGYIHFITNYNKNENVDLTQILNLALDPYTMVLSKKEYIIAIKIKEIIEKYKLTIKSVDKEKISIADELNKFKKLLDDGIINQDEFDKQKNKLLS